MKKVCSFCHVKYRPRSKYPKSDSIQPIWARDDVELWRGIDRNGIYVAMITPDSNLKFHLDFCPQCGRQLRVYKEDLQC